MAHRKQLNGKPTVSSAVRVAISRLSGVFHFSELRDAVWSIMPEANIKTIRVAVWNLVHKFKVLVSPRNQFYQLNLGECNA